MKSTKKGRVPMKPIKNGLAAGNRGRAPAPIQNLLQGRLQLFHDLCKLWKTITGGGIDGQLKQTYSTPNWLLKYTEHFFSGFALMDLSLLIHSFVWLGLWCLMPLSTIFQLYHFSPFYWWRKQSTQRKPQTNIIT